jgi:hypothetical protein
MHSFGGNLFHHRVPVVQGVGASMKSIENLPIVQWITIVTLKNFRPTDILVASEIFGDSLAGDKIYHGSWAVLRLNFEISEIKPGDICAVWTPSGSLLKHVYLTLDDKVRLVSSNPDCPDMLFDLDQVEIQGILEEVITSFR